MERRKLELEIGILQTKERKLLKLLLIISVNSLKAVYSIRGQDAMNPLLPSWPPEQHPSSFCCLMSWISDFFSFKMRCSSFSIYMPAFICIFLWVTGSAAWWDTSDMSPSGAKVLREKIVHMYEAVLNVSKSHLLVWRNMLKFWRLYGFVCWSLIPRERMWTRNLIFGMTSSCWRWVYKTEKLMDSCIDR